MSLPLFENYTVLSKEFPITNYLPFFFETGRNIYQIILSYTRSRGPNESLIQNKISSEIKILERTKVYYCFKSNGDNFNVIQPRFSENFARKGCL